ncbi:MAG: hypothetical protein Q8909_16825 [Bacteroidota bacterium]|nr:hypothetical protein [Bacteroidota bacterium]
MSEFARRCGVSEKLIRRAVTNGRLSCRLIGKSKKLHYETAKKEFEDQGMGLRRCFAIELRDTILAVPDEITDKLVLLAPDKEAINKLLTESLTEALDRLCIYKSIK